MSINTQEKQSSLIALGHAGGVLTMPIPSATGEQFRNHLLGLFAAGAELNETIGNLVDATYVIVRRYLHGRWMYITERFDDRLWQTVEDAFCVDCGLATTLYSPDAILTADAANGTGVTLEASAEIFASYMEGYVIRMGGGVATITAVTDQTNVVVDFTAPITALVPDDPDGMPLPAASGDWTIGVPVTTVTGLNALEGKEVVGLADGNVVGPVTVVDGAITLQGAATAIVVGLAFTPQVQTVYLDPPGDKFTAQGKRKNLYAVTVRMEASRGMSVGTNQPDAAVQPNGATVPWSGLKQFKNRSAAVGAGVAVPLFSGDERINVPADWNIKGQIAIEQPFPLPATVLALIPEWATGDTSG